MSLAIEHVEGATEPWVQDILVALLKGLQRPSPTVLECGGFLGHTSERFYKTLEDQGGGTLIVAEYDPDAPERAQAIDSRLVVLDATALAKRNVSWRVMHQDAIQVIDSLPNESLDFAYLDDDHTHPHVDEEIGRLMMKMRAGGIICGHDVHGSCNLQVEFKRYGGIALDLPRLGPAGGLGIIQV